MIYKFKGIDSSGKKVSDKLEALSLGEAKKKLKARKIIYQSINEDSPSFFENFDFNIKYVSPRWVYADSSNPELLDGVVNRIIVHMVE